MAEKQKSPNAFRTIGEVAEELDVAQHVLRFWERKFRQLAPVKRRGRRYYRPEDIKLLQQIKHLLHDQGVTIKGVQRLLAQGKLNEVLAGQADLFQLVPNAKEKPASSKIREDEEESAPLSASDDKVIGNIIEDISSTRDQLRKALEE